MRNTYYQHGLTAEEAANAQRVSPSFLKEFKASALRAWDKYLSPDRPVRDQTEAQRIGEALHCSTLEPQRFKVFYQPRLTPESASASIPADHRLVVGSDGLRQLIDELNASRPTKLSLTGTIPDLKQRLIDAGSELDPGSIEFMKGPELKLALEELNKSRFEPIPKSGTISEMRDRLNAEGMKVSVFSDVQDAYNKHNESIGITVLTDDEFELCANVTKSVRSKPESRIVLDHPMGEYEVELVFRCPITGLILKCRADYIIKPCEQYPDGLVVDPKFVESAELEGFRAAVRRYSMEIQAAFNVMAMKAVFGTEHEPTFVWLAAEKVRPFDSVYYYASADQIRKGHKTIAALLPKVAECIRTNVWPGYATGFVELDLTNWDKRELEETP